jgi:hypothetical protein
MQGNLSAEAMLVAIAVLPAPEVPITTTRICLSLVRANEDIQLRAKGSTPLPGPPLPTRGGLPLER